MRKQNINNTNAQRTEKTPPLKQLRQTLRRLKTQYQFGKMNLEDAKSAVQKTGGKALKQNNDGQTLSPDIVAMMKMSIRVCVNELEQLEREKNVPWTTIHKLELTAKYGKPGEREAAMDKLVEMYNSARKEKKGDGTDSYLFAFESIALRADDEKLRRRAFEMIKHDPMCLLDIVNDCRYADVLELACAMLPHVSFDKYYETFDPERLLRKKKKKTDADVGKKNEKKIVVKGSEEAGHGEEDGEHGEDTGLDEEEKGPPDLCDMIDSRY
jgi:hypothetical protein